MRSGCTVSGRMAIIELLMKQNIQEDQVDCTSRTAFAHTHHKKRTGGSEMRGSVTVNHASLLKSHQYSDESTSKPKSAAARRLHERKLWANLTSGCFYSPSEHLSQCHRGRPDFSGQAGEGVCCYD